MAEKLERYRQSSLGELLQAQQAAQAAIDSLARSGARCSKRPGELLGANAAAGGAAGHRSPNGPGEAARGRRSGRCGRSSSACAPHVLGGKGAYVPQGFEEAVRVPSAPDGERIFLPRATPIYGETGAVAGAAMVLQDVTRLRRFDELKNDLVATVAHEFRTPLTSLRMAIHLCTRGGGRAADRRSRPTCCSRRARTASGCRPSSTSCSNLSRIESGRIDLHRRRTEPEALVAAGPRHAPAPPPSTAEVTLARARCRPGSPEVFADPDRLQLVFTNLITQRHPLRPAGERDRRRAVPELVRADPEGHRVSRPGGSGSRSSDQGPGIPAEHQAGAVREVLPRPWQPGGRLGPGSVHRPGRSCRPTAARSASRASPAGGDASGSPFRLHPDTPAMAKPSSAAP